MNDLNLFPWSSLPLGNYEKAEVFIARTFKVLLDDEFSVLDWDLTQFLMGLQE